MIVLKILIQMILIIMQDADAPYLLKTKGTKAGLQSFNINYFIYQFGSGRPVK